MEDTCQAETPLEGTFVDRAPDSVRPVTMAAFWTVFLYFNLQFVVLLGSPAVLLCWKQFFPDWEYQATQPLDSLRLQLWSQAMVLPLQIALLLVLGGRSCFNLGNFPAWWKFLIGFLVVSLSCHGMNFILGQIMEKGFGIPIPQHPLTKLGIDAVASWDWIALTLSACVIAPIGEEVIFRRIVPRWFSQVSGPRALGMMAIGASILMSRPEQPFGKILAISAVVWAFLLWVIVEWKTNWSEETRLMVACSALFSTIHSFAWPTPVPLFFFALWQYQLARQTHGVGAVILFHAMFNGIGVVGLFSERFMK